MGQKKILIVDDEPGVVELIKNSLEKNDYEVVTASDGLEGTAALPPKPTKTAVNVRIRPVDQSRSDSLPVSSCDSILYSREGLTNPAVQYQGRQSCDH